MLLRKPKRTKCFKLQIDYWRIWRNFFVFPVDSRCTFWEQTFSILRILLLSSIIVGYPGFFTQILCLLLLLQCTQYRSKVSYHCLVRSMFDITFVRYESSKWSMHILRWTVPSIRQRIAEQQSLHVIGFLRVIYATLKLQWFSTETRRCSWETRNLSRETRLVSRETRREVVTYFWAVLYI